jgi:hypothetical protein
VVGEGTVPATVTARLWDAHGPLPFTLLAVPGVASGRIGLLRAGTPAPATRASLLDRGLAGLDVYARDLARTYDELRSDGHAWRSEPVHYSVPVGNAEVTVTRRCARDRTASTSCWCSRRTPAARQRGTPIPRAGTRRSRRSCATCPTQGPGRSSGQSGWAVETSALDLAVRAAQAHGGADLRGPVITDARCWVPAERPPCAPRTASA